ncbi:MAG: hypothetical protein JNM39_17260 [Bdellovibrionaceae bacterium]|nr:hypothetical protein [Pseudobdellovibrionaceae bacterium]
MKKITMLALPLLVAACSSTPKTEMEKAVANNIGEERIISRIDEMKSRPDWLKESEPFRVEGGKVLSLGQTTIPASDNLAAAYRIAESNSKAGISHSISQRLDYVFQDAQEGTALDSTQSRYIGATASQLTTSALKTSKRYWEKVAVVQEGGQVSVQYRIFVLSEMDEPQFKTAVLDAVRKAQGKQGVSADFAKKVAQHWDKFVGNTEVPAGEQRQPSTATENE